MRTLLAVAIAMSTLSLDVYGQARPGLAEERTVSRQVPGEHDGKSSECQADLAKLRQLVDNQRKYIELLEAKVKSLDSNTDVKKVTP